MFTAEFTDNATGRFAVLKNFGRRVLDPIIGRWAGRVLRRKLAGTGNYPSRRSEYNRTGELGARWAVQHISDAEYGFANTADHAIHVVGDGQGKRQARVHKGVWWTAVERVSDQFPILIDMVEDELEAI